MKRTNSKIKIFCLAASCIMLLVSSCVENDLEGTMRRSNEVRIAASVDAAVSAPVDTKSASVSESVINPNNQIIEFRSEDGSVVLPVRLTLTEKPVQASTKGTYVNGPNDDGSFPTGNLALSKAMDNFTMDAYYTDTQEAFVPANSKVEYKNSKWALSKTYYWPQSTGIDFYAHANMPTAQGVSIAVDKATKKQTLTYQVPDNTKNQTDILMAVYSGTGNTNGEAELIFRHPLTSVQFRRDPSASELEGVTKITMGGVHFKGHADQTLNATDFSWTIDSEEEEIVEQDNDGKPFEVHGEIDGDPFLLIPQSLEEHKNVSLTVILLIDGHEIPLNSTLDNVNWEAGKTYTYTISYAGSVHAEMSMTSVSGTVKTNPVIRNTGSRKCYVRVKAVGYITDVPGNAKSTWLNDNGINKGSFTVSSGIFGEGTWNSYWVAGTDGFWYYKQPLEWTGADAVKQTTALFDSYSITGLNPGELFDLIITSQVVEWDTNKKFVNDTWGSYAASLLNK